VPKRFALNFADWSNLNLIDRPSLPLVNDFQRRMTCVEEDDMAAVVLPSRKLLQTERVSESRRAIEVVHGQYEP
jgi:hypothetical protein